MIPTRRFDFSERPDMAHKLFENSHQLKITMSRGKGNYGPFLLFELEGGFDGESDAALLSTAKELLDAFQGLGRIPAKEVLDDEDDDFRVYE